MQYFDSHAHYDDTRFDNDRGALLASMPETGVTRIINVGSCVASSKASVLLAEAFPFVYAAVGVHPHEVEPLTDDGLTELEKLCKHTKVVAAGEMGLDYYYDHDRELQRFWFAKQLSFAEKAGLPVVIHSRDAAADTLDIIQNSGVRKGVLHCYSGSVETALTYIEMGFYIGVGGVVTFNKTKRLAEVVARIPMDRMLIETDAPYLTPVPFRGKRNDSSYLKYIVEAIAKIRGITPEAVAEQTYSNAVGLFAINLSEIYCEVRDDEA